MIPVRGYATHGPKETLVPYSFQRRDPGERDVRIEIKYCGICHSDIHQVRDEWGGSIFPMVPGHEIAGVVTGVGSKVTISSSGSIWAFWRPTPAIGRTRRSVSPAPWN